MSDPSTVVIVDPEAARAGLVSGTEFGDGQERILLTWEHADIEIRLALRPEAVVGLVVAVLNGLGYPEGDLEYISERYERIRRDS